MYSNPIQKIYVSTTVAAVSTRNGAKWRVFECPLIGGMKFGTIKLTEKLYFVYEF
jgi:hypothetical protein